MASAKQIILKVIPAKTAQEFIRQHHYSGKVVANSKLHFGCFIGGVLHGVMSYGSPMDKAKVINLVSNTKWNEMLELNRMAFDDTLPKTASLDAWRFRFDSSGGTLRTLICAGRVKVRRLNSIQ